MALLDRLGLKKKTSPAVEPLPEYDEEDVEKTTFIKGRLSAKAQEEMHSLRTTQREGVTRYRWEASQQGCFDAKEFATDGPYDMRLGSTRAAPIPGRETYCQRDYKLVAAED